jgi:hypothetical protein
MHLLAFPLLIVGCSGDPKPDTSDTSDTSGTSDTSIPDTSDTGSGWSLPTVEGLVFQTGFEPDTEHVYVKKTEAPCTDDLWGEDLSVSEKGHWEDDFEGGAFGEGHFCFGGGTRDQRAINLVPDPDDPDNQVLHMWISEPNEVVSDTDDVACNGEASGARKARIQHVLLDNPSLGAFQYRARLRLGDAFQALVDADYEISWMTIGEFWNNQSAEENSFRVTLNLIKPEAKAGAAMYFGVKADKQDDGGGSSDWEEVWPEDIVSDVQVPIGEWFTIEVEVVEGDESTGRVIMHVTKVDGVRYEVADVTGWTHSPDGTADGFKDINTMKIYTSGDIMCGLKDAGFALEAWWDDYAIGAP